MSVDYTLYTSINSEQLLAEHFSEALGLRRKFPDKAVPLVSDSLWVSIQTNLDEDWADEAAMLQSDDISLVTFVPDQSLSWPDETFQLSEVMRALVVLWRANPESTGALAVYEDLMMQRLPDAPIVLDQSVADSSEGGFNVLHAFDDLLDSLEVADIKTDL